MQQSKARNVSSRLCRAVNGVCNFKSLRLIFFRTRAMCCVPCAECYVTSMEGLPKRRPTLEAAVHVSNNTCIKIVSFFGANAHQVGNLSERRSYPLCFTAWSYVSGSVG
ncbi:hypothetical protein PoB_001441400 [Plakobranchus ocellatus]|uniref:Uncharacterized protein n=1 Tax=Plakobranchus ocellatus TaxID=259542 RepID=A0AAV3Z1H8_9GAST|nr:hypothetical protein PoB_001441400 [Plakobranchus ocellatus]